ncbi:MAG: hypothetical protein MZV63_15685 [Marinilabiliales bacterium]|nr:hypothetical protein [Marinilabiliales bacterium]
MGSTNDAPFTVVERCHFKGYTEACIRSNAFQSVIEDCDFEVYTAKYGILHVPNGADRPGTRIINNRFSTTDATNAVMINFSGTPTAGMCTVTGNQFINVADDEKGMSIHDGYIGQNYTNGVLFTT